MPLAEIVSPSRGVWEVGPFPLRAYALCILAGIAVAVVLGERRWRARGGEPGVVLDVATVAVPFGIVGARIYHVITSPDAYFGAGGDPVSALYVWEGGLGVWGGISAGALGAWLVCRSRGLSLSAFADVVAPGVVIAQAIGRLGNWFNQELYGRPTSLPWALRIDLPQRPDATLDVALYHPTFLYELLWNLGVAGLLLWAERRYRLGRGRVFALYVAAYCLGRVWIEALRVDDAERVLGLRLNVWTSVLVGLAAAAFLLRRRGQGPGPLHSDEETRPAEETDPANGADTVRGAGSALSDEMPPVPPQRG